MSRSEHTILLVDDDPDDLHLLREALDAAGSPYRILEAHDGEEAVNRLLELDSLNADPCLIVLDINMPRMNGRQTLSALKSNQSLSLLPVVVFSTSSSPRISNFLSNKAWN